VAAGADLYLTGRVERLIFSGTARGETYDEPGSMRDLALELGVPAHAILLDRGGFRTRETCQRARDIYGVRQALLVSQRYHLPRALILCESLGIEAEGAAADLREYSLRAQRFWELREYPATFLAFWEALWLRTVTGEQRTTEAVGGPGGA
jgi:vancomycin permeability regulator SanA